MARRILFLLIALTVYSASFGQSAVRSYEPEKLARQLIDLNLGVESGTGHMVFSETHETVGDLEYWVRGSALNYKSAGRWRDATTSLRAALDWTAYTMPALFKCNADGT